MAKPAEAAPKKEAPAQGGEAQPQKKSSDPSMSGPKGHTPLPGACHSVGCKAQATRFNFCEEHYDHFKFGLIKKTGERVSDWEKKIEHYQAHQARMSQQMRKAA